MKIKEKIVLRYSAGGIPNVLRGFFIHIFSPKRWLKRMRKIKFKLSKPSLYSLYFDKTKPVQGLNQAEKRDKEVIISFTSYPARFPTLHICIKSLLQQSYKPDKIILYLGDDAPEESLTENILNLVQYGLQIEHRPDNLRQHKKFFYVMQEYPDAIVICVDDDIIHEKDFVLSLMQSYWRYPSAVSSRKTHKLSINENSPTLSLKNAQTDIRTEKMPSMQLYAMAGLTLYPPKCMSDTAFDASLLKSDLGQSGDVWMKIMQILNGTPVVYAPADGLRAGYYAIPNSAQANSLVKQHKILADKDGRTGRDVCIERMEEHFGIRLADLCKADYESRGK